MMSKFLDSCLAPLRSVWANPVVVRDLRAQMRGTKSYWFQGAYLLLLGVLAISGYAQATGQSLSSLHGGLDTAASRVSIVEAQDRLEGFYYFIFLTLAALITLIAPALTAGAVIGERQRQSLDLLITTPLSAGELLVGKMLSSIAFLGLLLGLSLPASALCVLLGGATIGDVFRIYALLAIDGVVLAAIGLFFSCASRTGLLALVWTYTTVAAVLFVSGMIHLYFVVGNSEWTPGNFTLVAMPSPLVSFTILNPFIAVLQAGQTSWSIGQWSVPAWLGTAAAAVLVTRLLVTAAAYRLGAHGAQSGPSLRRQALLLSGGAMLLLFCVNFSHAYNNVAREMMSRGMNIVESGFVFDIAGPFATRAIIVAFFLAVPFLPGLFVPVSPEDAPPGTAESDLPADTGVYRMRRAFFPEHAGALPYFHLLVMAFVAAALAGCRIGFGALPFSVIVSVLCVGFYVSGLGFCFWAISRLAAGLVRGVTQARAIAFGIFCLLCAGPIFVFSLTLAHSWNNEPAATLWLLYPFMKVDDWHEQSRIPLWCAISGLQAFAWSFAFVLARMRWHKTASAPAVAA